MPLNNFRDTVYSSFLLNSEFFTEISSTNCNGDGKPSLNHAILLSHTISQDILVLLIFKISTEEGKMKQIIPS